MLVIQIHLWPGGDRSRARHMGTCFIVNTGQGTRELGSYEVFVSRWGDPTVPWRVAAVTGFQRLKGSPWELLRRAVVAAMGTRNTDHGLRRRMLSVARRAMSGQPDLMGGADEDAEGAYGTPSADDVPVGPADR